ncbi:MAG: GAF domain-containing protein [Spirochaetaceae bacterium]|jgi:GAF domain-containing protein|nr:GAF domain-containing protein [Spirochaetaceae bacterium]
MFNSRKEQDRAANLALLADTVQSMLEAGDDPIAALANVSAVINFYLDDINWVGFYFLKGKDLVLGPFQGLPACTRIEEGKGVCGRAAATAKPVIVANVHEFPGHIACDSASNSEIVIPLFQDGRVYGVLDVDSPSLNRFSGADAAVLTRIGEEISAFLSGKSNFR